MLEVSGLSIIRGEMRRRVSIEYKAYKDY